MSKGFCIAAVVSTALMMATPAAALSFEEIAGKWCSEFGSEQFARDTLTVIRKDGSRSDYRVARYEFQGDQVTVHWRNGRGDQVSTDFGQFSRDGRTMLQLKTDEADPIPHHRC